MRASRFARTQKNDPSGGTLKITVTAAEPKDNSLFLPKVMSRKKQIIPMLTALWG